MISSISSGSHPVTSTGGSHRSNVALESLQGGSNSTVVDYLTSIMVIMVRITMIMVIMIRIMMLLVMMVTTVVNL